MVDVEERGMSKEAEGDASEKASDFRRAGGKKPSALRGMRPISVGLLSFGRSTQESCLHGGSESALECEEDGTSGLSVVWDVGEPQPLGVGLESGPVLFEPLPYSPSNRSSSS